MVGSWSLALCAAFQIAAVQPADEVPITEAALVLDKQQLYDTLSSGKRKPWKTVLRRRNGI
jgi:hypothetical protein